ncbi:MAG: hypothetical protein DHS20C02_03930 [Micavibrio sp.]|nr:MAG: hypothetical protein DHS20C02_03930 [Micavibrio sp.]
MATLLVFCFAPVVQPLAQDVFVKQHKGSKKPKPSIIDLNPQKPQEQVADKKPVIDDRELTSQLQGQTAVSKDMVNTYYKNCIAQKNATLSTESQELLCSCTSVKMADEMSVEEIQTMFEDTPAGQKMRNVMLVSVYAPCMKFPAHDLLYKNCTEDKAVSQNLKKSQAVCECLATNMADYTTENAPAVISKALKKNPENVDPLALLFDDLHFNSQSKTVLTRCLYKHEYGWK